MSKTFDTKRKIINLLSRSKMTLTEISHELHLAPSTVCKHIKELMNVGAISKVENEFINKWKYYQTNPSFDIF